MPATPASRGTQMSKSSCLGRESGSSDMSGHLLWHPSSSPKQAGDDEDLLRPLRPWALPRCRYWTARLGAVRPGHRAHAGGLGGQLTPQEAPCVPRCLYHPLTGRGGHSTPGCFCGRRKKHPPGAAAGCRVSLRGSPLPMTPCHLSFLSPRSLSCILQTLF